jgi:putative hydrolase of the HAD superfamily
LDIPVLKEEIDHLITVHPHVPEFLDWLRSTDKRVVLVTNAHGMSLDLKMRKTGIGNRFDAVHSAHDLGLAKEETAFWDRLQAAEPFDPDNTLLIDDNASVLRSAQDYGIRHLVAVLLPDTTQPLRQVADFPGIQDFRELMPANEGG